jgi:hypothetical protein
MYDIASGPVDIYIWRVGLRCGRRLLRLQFEKSEARRAGLIALD